MICTFWVLCIWVHGERNDILICRHCCLKFRILDMGLQDYTLILYKISFLIWVFLFLFSFFSSFRNYALFLDWLVLSAWDLLAFKPPWLKLISFCSYASVLFCPSLYYIAHWLNIVYWQLLGKVDIPNRLCFSILWTRLFVFLQSFYH